MKTHDVTTLALLALVTGLSGQLVYAADIATSVSIDGTGNYLLDDGRGTYLNGIDYVASHAGVRLALQPYAYTGGGKAPAPIRSLRYDLTNPIAGSGATNLGVITDNLGNRVLACWQTIGGVTSNVTDIPIGSTVTSQSLEVFFRINGSSHLLAFGAQTCSTQGKASPGTGNATITRTSATSWDVNLPAGSAGRLWGLKSSSSYQDKGLYSWSAALHFNAL